MIFKYRIHCNTENKDKEWLLKDTDPTPTKCPDDSAHSVNLSTIAVIQMGDVQEVETRFEKRDKTIKLAHGEATVDGITGVAIILLKVPGEPNVYADITKDGRWISSGTAFFDVHTPGDKVLGVYFTDEDNHLGFGNGTVVGSYTDDDADEPNRGWAILPNGFIKAEAIGGYGFAPAGFYIKIVAKKAGESPNGTFWCNIEWGKRDPT